MKSYKERVLELEEGGLTTSDAQAATDIEVERGEVLPSWAKECEAEIKK
jgi:hypothetical protein